MANASQRHKLETRGYDSFGNRKALSKVMSNSGTDVIEVVIELYGLWSDADSITVTTNIGAGNVVSNYSPSGNEDASAAATGIAAAINAQTDHTANAYANVVRATKTTAGVIDVVSVVIA